MDEVLDIIPLRDKAGECGITHLTVDTELASLLSEWGGRVACGYWLRVDMR
jgi:hypothetical protein